MHSKTGTHDTAPVAIKDVTVRFGKGIVVPIEQLDPNDVLSESMVWISGAVSGYFQNSPRVELVHQTRWRKPYVLPLTVEKGKFATSLHIRNGLNKLVIRLLDSDGKELLAKNFSLYYKSSFREWNETVFIAFFLALVIRSLVVQAFWIPTGSMEPTLLGEKRDLFSQKLLRQGDRILVNRFAYVADFSLDSRISRLLATLLPCPDLSEAKQELSYLDKDLIPSNVDAEALLKNVYCEHVWHKRLRFWLSFPKRGDIVVFKFPDKNPLNPPRDFIKRVIGLPGDKVEIIDGKVFVNGKQLKEPYISEPPLHDFETTVPNDALFVMGDNRNNSADSRYWGPMPLSNLKGQAVFLYWPLPRLRPIRSYSHDVDQN